MIIGYFIRGDDNDSFMLPGEQEDPPLCPACGFIVNSEFHNPFFRLKKKTFDFSHPYDIGNIVSLRFKEFCLRENYPMIAFKEFERQPGFFQLIVDNVLKFDISRANTEFGKKCGVCGRYDFTVGFEPTHLQGVEHPLEDGFYKTDILFGSGNGKNALTIIGIQTYEKLKREKMKGISFNPLFN